MKSEVVLLTKAYRQEDTLDWINHYQKLGFDHITVYLNDYEPVYNMTDENYKNVTMYLINGFPNQIELYNNHYARNKEYDWILFVDDDEYLWLNKSKYPNINSFLSSLPTNTKLFGIWWQFASYKEGEEPEDRNISMKQAFKYVPEGEYHTQYKSFVKAGQVGKFINPHTFVNWNNEVNTCHGLRIDPMKPYDTLDPSNDPIKIVHYWRKSKKEMERKYNMLTPDHVEPMTYGQTYGPEGHTLKYTKKL